MRAFLYDTNWACLLLYRWKMILDEGSFWKAGANYKRTIHICHNGLMKLVERGITNEWLLLLGWNTIIVELKRVYFISGSIFGGYLSSNFTGIWSSLSKAFKLQIIFKMAKITKERMKGCVKSSALTIATLCGVIGGIVLGITLKNAKGKLMKTIEVLMCNVRMLTESITVLKTIFLLRKQLFNYLS